MVVFAMTNSMDHDEAEASTVPSSSVKFDFFTAHFGEGAPSERELLALIASTKNGQTMHQNQRMDGELAEQYICTQNEQIEQISMSTQISPDQCIPFRPLLRHFHQLRSVSVSSHAVPPVEQFAYQFIGRYMDLLCCDESVNFQPLLCLHSLNHVMRTRNAVISNKQRLEKAKEQGTLSDELIEQCRDQGLARPKVLVLTPMRKFAHSLVRTMIELMFSTEEERPFVQKWQRFDEEFGDAEGNQIHVKREVAQDYRDLMTGNVDDCFRIGIGLAKKCLKLYTPFDEADIVLCSPLGLKMLLDEAEAANKEAEKAKKSKNNPLLKIGEERKRKLTHSAETGGGITDFLASIEVLIVEQADILLMQNWEHLQRAFELVNSVPRRVHTDITRVRPWSAQGTLARHFRQTLLFARTNFVEAHALFAQFCSNYAGCATIIRKPAEPAQIEKITIPCQLEFHRFDVASPEQQADKRFQHFIREIFPKCPPGTLLFISSYFDFVRLRNWLKRQTESFAQLHEYAEAGKVAKARELFVKGDRRLMLLTERFYFYFRYRIKGVKHVVFYQPPVNPQFYVELIQMPATIGGGASGDLSSVLLFSKFDCLRLQNILGTRATKALLGRKSKAVQRLTAK